LDITTKIAQAHTRHYLAIETIMADVVGEEHPQGSLLVDMCDYHLGTGGKRLRALLPVLLAEALDVDTTQIYPFAAACEMLHNATLVHDDVQDGDTARRGHPTVWVKYSSPQAINLGDAMYFYALLCLDHLEVDARRRWQLAHLLLQSTTRVIDGQVQEFQLQGQALPTTSDYLQMIQRKTSALFALPLVGSATLCEASPALRGALAEAAVHLGVVFQLQDDLLDLYGEKGRARRGSDILEGKISALVVHSLELAAPQDREHLREVLAKPRQETTAADVAWATALMKECGAQGIALDEIRRREAAVASLEGLKVAPAARMLVTGLTEAFVAPISHLFASDEVSS
jgi:geranylgeranyl diphosphate synthase, type I